MISTKAQKALKLYGAYNCRRAWERNTEDEEGAHTIALTMPTQGNTIKTTRQADAAINAYAEVVEVTRSVLAQYAGRPQEFYMLKGLLCLDHGNGVEYAITNYDVLALGLSCKLIAERMDQINRTGV